MARRGRPHLAPRRRYQVWHDRAAFHFLVADRARDRYLRTLHAATTPDAVAVFGCFASDGPQQCSGLPVARYGPDELAAELGREWTLVSHAREDHITPGGVVQPFTWAAFSRRGT